MEILYRPVHVGIIPARAGFTPCVMICVQGRLDHPRSRGVYFPDVTTIIFDEGSSPLARGLLGERIDCATENGIIPARAGFTGQL